MIWLLHRSPRVLWWAVLVSAAVYAQVRSSDIWPWLDIVLRSTAIIVGVAAVTELRLRADKSEVQRTDV